MASLVVSVLGPLQVSLDGTPIEGFEYAKVRALLAYLAVAGDTAQPRDALAALLWPGQPASTARRNLSQALSALRQALGQADEGARFLVVTPGSLQITGEVACDAARFTALLEASERHRHRSWHTCSACASRLEAALTLYRGAFLSQFYLADSAGFEEWAALWRERLQQRAMAALRRLIQRAEWRGDAQMVEYARRLVEIDPLHESSHRERMRVLALDGQWSAAEAQYGQLRRLLAAELGVEPEAETTALFNRIRERANDGLRRLGPPPFNCPIPPSPLVGRAAPLREVCDRLRAGRLRALTLTGTPGLGKTRLAVEAAHALRYDFEHGVCLVELAPLAAPGLVPSALAQALGIKEEPGVPLPATLLTHLKDRHMLLVIDNFEHVLEAAGFVDA